MEIRYGLIAVRGGEILHFCGYESPPSQADLDALRDELQTDPEFALDLEGVFITIAPPDVVGYYRRILEEHGGL